MVEDATVCCKRITSPVETVKRKAMPFSRISLLTKNWLSFLL
jgi:hypothetical protein